MKRVIKAQTETATDRRVKMHEFLLRSGVSEHEILDYFFDELPSEDAVAILENFIAMSDLEDEWDEYRRAN